MDTAKNDCFTKVKKNKVGGVGSASVYQSGG